MLVNLFCPHFKEETKKKKPTSKQKPHKTQSVFSEKLLISVEIAPGTHRPASGEGKCAMLGKGFMAMLSLNTSLTGAKGAHEFLAY